MKKIVTLLLTVAMAATLLVGCGNDDKTFTVGFDAEYPPYGYMDENGEDFRAKSDSGARSGNREAERIISLLGGRENIVLVDSCMTRLRVTVKNPDLVADADAWRAEGALGLLKKGEGIQAIYGPRADVLKSDINDAL